MTKKKTREIAIKNRRKTSLCLNCSSAMNAESNYCSKCGQENHQKRVSMRLLLDDFMQDYLTFDSKLFKSLIPLIFKPGFLTKEYLRGKRKTYIPPIRMYLFISFIYFFTSSFLPHQNSAINVSFGNEAKESTSVRSETNNNVVNEEYELEETDTIKKFFDKKNKLISKDNGLKFKKLFEKYFSLFLFFTIPALALSFAIFFYRKGNLYIDHFVFSLHFMSFFFVIYLLNKFLTYVFYESVILNLIIALLLFVYVVLGTKQVYDRSGIGNVLRVVGVGVLHLFLTVGIFFVFLITILLLGY